MGEVILQDWFHSILSGLVTSPEEISITVTNDEQGVLFTVKVAKEDVGKVIGKNGLIAQALRTILRSAGFKQDARVSMKVDAPNSKFDLADGER